MIIGIAGALEEEIKLLQRNMEISGIENLTGHDLYSGRICGRSVVLTTTGVGKARAAARTQLLIDRYSIKLLVFVGIAGAINPVLKIGDVVISEKALQHDFTEFDGNESKPGRWYLTEPDLVKAARTAARNLGLNDIRAGSILTGDHAVTDTGEKELLWKKFGGDCVEMEGAAAAMVCWMNKVPFVLIRTISDLGDSNAIADARKWVAEASGKSARIAMEMLKILPE